MREVEEAVELEHGGELRLAFEQEVMIVAVCRREMQAIHGLSVRVRFEALIYSQSIASQLHMKDERMNASDCVCVCVCVAHTFLFDLTM